ncbi:TolC family protein [Rhodohalobacter sp.]|uniref:TolC family protein n=1 Tax=Rhodohalobacter sp. TaxID=1974210 RepID=UPI002ACE152C|nr:TolC family protein [Rhodohalobacter sp.]MDZ7756237.1 TolC family protein [Rhodohalobacter sp.]
MPNKIKLAAIIIATLFFGLMGVKDGFAQQTLNLEDAIQLGLERNFAIRIAENDARISENNNSIGNAGFLPVISADGAINKRIEDNETRYGSGAPIPDRNDEGCQKPRLYSYGVNASWTHF